ncbi:hypothetical protein MnTg03_00084 [bacterium MnTg03]|nr:hypothetical protein MnTg03_00084 [bacterium MnTg03]
MGDTANFIGAMIDRVHARHNCEQGLGGTDITGRLFAANVLLASLQGQAQCGLTTAVDRNTYQASRHRAFERFARGHVGSMRAAITQWYAKTLRSANHDIGIEFPRWFEQGKAE